jgi:hypothetical protein
LIDTGSLLRSDTLEIQCHSAVDREGARRRGKSAGGEDKEIEVSITKVTIDQWSSFLNAFEQTLSSAPGVWHGLESLDSVHIGDVIGMPYMNWSHELKQFVELSYQLGLVVPFDWMSWPIPRYDGQVSLTSPVDTVKIVTSVIRGDRFNEGLLDSCLSSGNLRPAYMVFNAAFGSDRNLRSE